MSEEQTLSAFAAELASVRLHQLSEVRDELVPGVSALATPVFDGFGRLVLCLAAIVVGIADIPGAIQVVVQL